MQTQQQENTVTDDNTQHVLKFQKVPVTQKILSALEKATEPMTAKELCSIIGEKRPSVTSILSQLFNKGYVARTKQGHEFLYTFLTFTPRVKREKPAPEIKRPVQAVVLADDDVKSFAEQIDDLVAERDKYKAIVELLCESLDAADICVGGIQK